MVVNLIKFVIIVNVEKCAFLCQMMGAKAINLYIRLIINYQKSRKMCHS